MLLFTITGSGPIEGVTKLNACGLLDKKSQKLHFFNFQEPLHLKGAKICEIITMCIHLLS
jgi:hypothetical protein